MPGSVYTVYSLLWTTKVAAKKWKINFSGNRIFIYLGFTITYSRNAKLICSTYILLTIDYITQVFP
jgi:hypothetical protein